MLKWPAVVLFFGLCVGIFIENASHLLIGFWVILLCINLIFSLIIHIYPNRRLVWLFQLFVFLISISLGAILFEYNYQKIFGQNAILNQDDNAVLFIRPLQKQKTTEYYNKWFVRGKSLVKNDSLYVLNSKLLLQFPKEKKYHLDFNSSYFVHGKLRKVKTALSPQGFDYSKYLMQKGIVFQITIDTLILNKTEEGFSLKNFYLKILNKINNAPLNQHAKETLKALTLADRTEMNPESVKVFSMAGIIHLFAISGLHIGLLFGLIYFLLRKLFSYKRNVVIIVLSLAIISLYGAFIQFPTSVSRAILMLIMYYGFQIFKRPSLSFHSMAMAGIILLCINPYQLFDVGFQLSFAAVFFIFWLYQPFMRIFKTLNRSLKTLVSVTLSAQLGTLPLSLFYFHQLSLIGLFLNILIMPLAGVLVIISFLVLLMILLFPELNFTYHFYNGLSNSLFMIASKSAEINQILVQKISFSLSELISLAAVIFYLKFVLEKRNQKTLIRLLFLLTIFLGIRFYIDYKSLKLNELTAYNDFKNTVISMKSGNELHFWSTNSLSENFKTYSIEPYWLYRRKPKINYHSLNDSKMQINEQTIWLVNNSELPENTTISDLIILQNSPKIDRERLLELPANTIIMDGSNYPDYVEEIKEYFKNKESHKLLHSTYSDGYYQLDL